ncbi:MAG: hypothetical protein KDA59_21525 [Planctomycetales bacterium]|nr:hypothetical protein [Planctomycetales bacterium]
MKAVSAWSMFFATLLAVGFGSAAQAESYLLTDYFQDSAVRPVGCTTACGCEDTGCTGGCTDGCCTAGGGCCDSALGCDSCVSDLCCDDCGDACGCCDDLLLGLFTHSDHCACDFISPMTNPVFFEDPRTLTEVRAIFVHHVVPGGATGGGNVRVIAAQVRAALTDRLSIIATKDGFISASNPLIQDGWADISLGLKYNLYADYCTGTLLSAGATYEMPVGSTQALQGNGDGEFHVFLTGGQRLGCRGHWISGAGFRLPADPNDESTMFYWSNHWDYLITNKVYFLTEVNWFNWTRSGAGGIPGIEGGDFFNFGSTGVAGNDIVTGAFGFKYKPSCNMELGIAWEVPLTERRDVLDNRLTVDAIFRY